MVRLVQQLEQTNGAVMRAKRDLTTVQITKSQAKKLDRIAAKAGVNRSILIRWMVDSLDPSSVRIGLNNPTVQSIELTAPAEAELVAA